MRAKRGKRTWYRNEDMAVIMSVSNRNDPQVIGKFESNLSKCRVFDSVSSAEDDGVEIYEGNLYIGSQNDNQYTAPYRYVCFGSLEEVESQLDSKLKEMLKAHECDPIIF